MSKANGDPETLASDLGAFMEARDAVLITLVAGEMELAVHKSVLVAKSPVFAAMLAHDTVEASTGRITIADIKPEVLQQLMVYMYTGDAPQLCRMAPHLLVAADKYCLPELKAQCELQLAQDLAVENAVSSALLAMRHSCPRLKEVCGIFIKANISKVVGSEGWAEAVGKYPEEFVEVSRLAAPKPVETSSGSQEELDQKLLSAAKNNRIAEIKKLLTLGSDPRGQDARGWTALHHAAASGAEKAVRYLLQAGARVELRDKSLQTPLHTAVQRNQLVVVKQFLAASIMDVNTPDGHGDTPLHLAAQWGSEEVVKALLDAGADKDARNGQRETPVAVAKRRRREQLLTMLSVSDSANISETSENTETPVCLLGALLKAENARLITLVAGDVQLAVHRSVLVAKSPVFAAMLAHEASSSRIAIADVDPQVLQQLLLFMYQDCAPQLCSMAPQLLEAAEKYQVSELKAQCELQMIRDLSLDNVMASAVVAVRHSCPRLKEAAHCFLETNFTKVVGTEGWAQAVYNHPEEYLEVSRLFATPAKPRSASEEEMGQKLLKAVNNQDVSEALQLIDQGAYLGTRDVDGRTAIHFSADKGFGSNLNKLVEAGVDVGSWDVSGRTALHYAAARGFPDTSNCLLQAGAHVDVRDRWLQTPLHYAIQGNNLDVVKHLLAASSGVNSADMYGNTPLHLAAQRGNEDVVKALLDAGADKATRNNWRETPVDVADWLKRDELLNMLG